METAKRCRKQNEQHPEWFADTYDLNSEVANFIAAYEDRKRQAVDNHWIIKGNIWSFKSLLKPIRISPLVY